VSLYTPAHFAVDDRAAIAHLIREYPFATLVTPAAPEPYVSHLPLLHVEDGTEHGMLIGHFARANPHVQHASGVESTAIFHGPHAYVSPSWYAAPERMVPTWNYATVHAHGTLEPVADLAAAEAVLQALVQRFEAGRSRPWRFAMAEPQRSAMIKAIAAFHFRIRRLEAKFKLSQNRDDGDRARVARALRGEGYAEATATAEWMERYAAARPDGK
jgi:transcriptional regulator